MSQRTSATQHSSAQVEWATVPEAAKHWQVTPSTIRRWIAAGEITAYRVGPRSVRINLAEADAQFARVR